MTDTAIGSLSWSGPPDGPVVALVHGAMDRGAGLARVARHLDDIARVVRYDRRGYGRAVAHPGPFRIADQVDDLVAVLDGRPAVLVGHSLGGVIVLAAADRHPELAVAVVAFEPPMPWVEWWPGDSASARAAAGPEVAADEVGDIAERFMRRLVGNRRWEELPQRTRDIRRSEGRALVAELRDLARPPFDPERITCPVVVGVSEHGRPHHVRAAHELTAQLSGGRLIELAGCHHDAHSSVPGAFAEQLVAPLLPT